MNQFSSYPLIPRTYSAWLFLRKATNFYRDPRMTKRSFGTLKASTIQVNYLYAFFKFIILGKIENQVIDLHKDSVLKVNFNHNGTLFATADMLGKIYIFDAADNSMLYEVNF